MELLRPIAGVSLCGIEDPALPRGARALFEWVAAAGFRAVAIDGASPDTRPREMDRSARRGVAATLRRLELDFAGVEMWIPPEHLLDATRSDRALSAMRAALQAAAEIADLAGGLPVVSTTLPGHAGAELLDELDREGARVGATLADHAWPASQHAGARAMIRPGIDPAAVLASGDDPAMAAASAGDHLAAVRLSDMDASGRVVPGDGRLALDAYVASILSVGGPRTLTLDLRGVRRQSSAAARTVERLASHAP